MSEARMKHGSETFFIEGEGLLVTQVGGRTGEEADPVSESETPTAAAPKALAADVAPPFRFRRVGPVGTALGAAATKKLARAMVVGGGGAGGPPLSLQAETNSGRATRMVAPSLEANTKVTTGLGGS